MKQSRKERRAQARMERKQAPVSGILPNARSSVCWRNRALLVVLALTSCAIAATVFVHKQRQQQKPEKIVSTPFATVPPQLGNTPLPRQPAVDRARVINDAPLPPRGHLTLETLLERSPEGINGIDIAEINLLCATGLPGAGQIDIPKSLALLDQWAGVVKASIEQNRHRFVANPAEYRNSESFFKMVMLVLTLQQDLKVHYDTSKIGAAVFSNDTEAVKRDMADESYFRDSKSIFLHGILGDEHLGTCSSMPVLYVAIARRLGFPVKLVTTVGHLFVRWDGNGERFNIEGTGQGVDSPTDEDYMTWPLPITKEDIARQHYLKSLTPAEELATFMEIRATCLKENQRLSDAMVAVAHANRFRPHVFNTQVGLANIAGVVTMPANRREPSPQQLHKQAEMQAEATNYQNQERERARLLQEIQQLRGNPNQPPGMPTPTFNTGFPQTNSPFSPSGLPTTPTLPVNSRQNFR